MIVIAVLIVLIVIFIGWGMHFIGPKNVGVVQRMGKYVGKLTPWSTLVNADYLQRG